MKTLHILLLGILFLSFTSALNYAGGTGSSANPYQITNWTALNDTRYNLTSYFILNNSLNSSMPDYIPLFTAIGNQTTGFKFLGSLDGQNYTIEGLKMNVTKNYYGLFGYADEGYIRNLKIQNANITGTISTATTIGIVVGYMDTGAGYIRNVHIYNSSIRGVGEVGGFMGSGYAQINDSSFNGNVTGTGGSIAGIAGSFSGKMNNVSSSGIVTASSTSAEVRAGGIAGWGLGEIKNAYSNMTITGNKNRVGGISGDQGYSTTPMSNVTFAGNVTGTQYVGGIVGYMTSNGQTNDNWTVTGKVTGTLSEIGGFAGGYLSSSTTGLGTINNSYFGGIVNATGTGATHINIGGFFGTVSSYYLGTKVVIQNGISNGTIIARSNVTGGFVGKLNGGTIKDSYSMSNITGVSFCGGAVGTVTIGVNEREGNSNLLNVYSKGNVSCTGLFKGGLIGSKIASTKVTNSYWDMNTSGLATSDGGIGYTTLQMKDPSNFIGWNNYITSSDLNNGYPYLGREAGNTTYVWLQPNNYPNQPTFVNIQDNSESLLTNGTVANWGTARFNVTVFNTNGTVYFNNSILATNLVGDIYNVSFPITDFTNISYNYTTWNTSSSGLKTTNYDDYLINTRCVNKMVGWANSTSPCQITSWTDLNASRYDVSIYYNLVNNLSNTDGDYITNFLPLGSNDNANNYVKGVFDGRNNTITGLKITSTAGYVGLFSYLTGIVKDFNFVDSNVTSTSTTGYIGTVTGYLNGGDISNVNVKNGFVRGYTYVGGLIGQMVGTATLSTIIYSNFNGNVSATYRAAGGIAGYTSSTGGTQTYLRYVSSSGYVFAPSGGGNSYVGGLVGLHSGQILNSYSSMTVNGTGAEVGGVVGRVSNSVQLINVTSNGSVYCGTSSDYCGGVVGYLGVAPSAVDYVVINNISYYGTVNCASTYCGGLAGGFSETAPTYIHPRQMNNSYFGGIVNATGTTKLNVGGLVGYLFTGNTTHIMIENSVSNGTIYSLSNRTGGLVGYAENGIINNSYSMTNISGTNFCAGGVGVSIKNTTLNKIYSAGLINCTGLSGGLMAVNTTNTSIVSSYWDINATNQTTSAGGTGLTTAQMKDIASYIGWNILTTTVDLNNGYPYLGWQNSNSTVWLIPVISPSNCWLRIDNLLFIPRGCLYQVNRGILG